MKKPGKGKDSSIRTPKENPEQGPEGHETSDPWSFRFEPGWNHKNQLSNKWLYSSKSDLL